MHGLHGRAKVRVLVVKLSSLGDLFHALPAVHMIKRALKAEIHWVTQEEYMPVVECFGDVSRVMAFPRQSFFERFRPFVAELRRERYDYVLDFQGLLKSAMVSRLARGRQRVGPSFHREGTRIFYNAVAGRRNRQRHAVEQCLDTVRFLGVQPTDPVFPVAFPRSEVKGAHPRVAFVPASRWISKNWPAHCFVDLAQRLRSMRDLSIFLLGGPADTRLCGEIARELGGEVTDLSGRTSLVETGGVIQEMDLVVANDSGPVHMSVAVGTPTVVIFGPTDPARTGPYGAGHRVVCTSMPCQPCFSRSCRIETGNCLEGVTPERVAEVVRGMLWG